MEDRSAGVEERGQREIGPRCLDLDLVHEIDRGAVLQTAPVDPNVIGDLSDRSVERGLHPLLGESEGSRQLGVGRHALDRQILASSVCDVPALSVALEAEIDPGQHPCSRPGLRHEDAAHHAWRDVFMGMTGEEDIDAGDRGQSPDEVLVGGAIGFAGLGVLLETGVGEDHDHVAVLLFA